MTLGYGFAVGIAVLAVIFLGSYLGDVIGWERLRDFLPAVLFALAALCVVAFLGVGFLTIATGHPTRSISSALLEWALVGSPALALAAALAVAGARMRIGRDARAR